MYLESIINKKHTAFINLCKTYKVDKLYAFGSSITIDFNPEKSDVDLIVKVDIDDPLDKGDALLSLWDELELFFGRKVDLLTEDAIKNPYLKSSIERTKKLIYDGKREEVLV